MATRLTEKIYVSGGYLDANMTVSSIDELKSKFDFIGQTVHMSEAFVGVNDIPYPLDFWSIPNGDDVKWVVKTIPAIESEDDFEKFKDFISDFNNNIGYYPISEGSEVLVNGTKYNFNVKNENGGTTVIWSDNQTVFDETISDAVDLAVNNAIDNITSGASEAFDTLKEIEDWIKQNGGNIKPGESQDLAPLYASAHTHDNKEVIDTITTEKITKWDNSNKAGGTVLDESITVTRDAGNYKNGMTIEEGTTVLEVLKNFLRTTYYPSIATKPTADIVINGEVLESYEIGSTIEIPEVSINTINGKFNYNNYSGVEVNGGDFYEVKIKSELIDGFENYISSNEYVDNKIDSQSNIVVSEGVNEIVFNGYTKYNAPNNMPTTSEGVSTTQTGSTGSDNSATWESGEIILNKTIKVFGYRNIYFGTTDSKEEISNDLIKSLNITNKVVTNDTVLETVTEDINNHNRMIIAVPENKTLKLVEDSTSTQDITKLLLLTEKKLEIYNENSQETSIYNVYDKSWAGSFGNETWFIKIKNK